MSKERCFIIAPISTPPERLHLYPNDPDHCKHAIEFLLVPAIEQAGLEAVRPIAKGAELIHAGIVRNLQEAALVLCDMSGLNPNVFFELGIRTAMNKPVCIVRDDATDRTPFDMAPINNHTYSSNFAPWILPKEIDRMAAHITQSMAAKDNALWKYFGLTISAKAAENEPGANDALALIRMELDALRNSLAPRKYTAAGAFGGKEMLAWSSRDAFLEEKARILKSKIWSIGMDAGVPISGVDVDYAKKQVVITTPESNLTDVIKTSWENIVTTAGLKLVLATGVSPY